MNLRLTLITAVIGSLTLLVAACQSTHHDRFRAREGNFWDQVLGTHSYQSLFDEFTEKRSINSDFENVLAARITPWNRELREAYVREMTAQFRLSEEKSASLAKEQLAEDEASFVFVLTLNTREPHWNDLSRKTSHWKLTLENASSNIQLEPEKIELISTKDETSRYFYHVEDPFGLTYKIHFKRSELRQEPQIFFHLTGAKGSFTVNFDNRLVSASPSSSKQED